FTMLRDPVSRFRSHFLNRSVPYQRSDFDRWAADPLMHNWQTKMIAAEPNADKAIEVLSTRLGFAGLTERFDESILLIRQWLREPGFCPEYRRVNQYVKKGTAAELERKREATKYLDSAEVRARMQEFNAEDQKVYDYVANIMFPQQIAAHRGDLAAEF